MHAAEAGDCMAVMGPLLLAGAHVHLTDSVRSHHCVFFNRILLTTVTCVGIQLCRGDVQCLT